jgi:hypothetical protein
MHSTVLIFSEPTPVHPFSTDLLDTSPSNSLESELGDGAYFRNTSKATHFYMVQRFKTVICFLPLIISYILVLLIGHSKLGTYEHEIDICLFMVWSGTKSTCTAANYWPILPALDERWWEFQTVPVLDEIWWKFQIVPALDKRWWKFQICSEL